MNHCPRRAPGRLTLHVTLLAALLALASAALAQIGGDPATLADIASVEAESLGDGTFRTAAGLVVEPVVRNGALFSLQGRSEVFEDADAQDLAALVGAATGFGGDIEQPLLDFLERALPELAGAGPSAVGIERFRLTLDVAGASAPFDVRFTLALAEVPEEAFPEARHAKGPADAAVVIREFSDFQCPACRRFNLDVMPELEAVLMPRGDVRIEYHHFPLITSFANSLRAAEASECVVDANADDPEAFWSYKLALYEHQPAWAPLARPDETFVQIAADAGLETQGVAACLAEGVHAERLQDDYRAALALQLRGTPSVFVGGFQIDNIAALSAYELAIYYLEAFGAGAGADAAPAAD